MTRIVSQPAWMLGFACLTTLGAGTAFAEIKWQTQLKTAHAQAQQEGKLLLLHFYNDNCVWCDRLEQGAFQSPEVTAAIHKDYVPVKIHAGHSPNIAATFKVTRFPTDVIVTTQGQALSHTVSPQDPSGYIAMLAQIAQPASSATEIASATPPDATPANSASPTGAPPASTTAPPATALAASAPAPYQSAGFVMPPANAGTTASSISHRTDSKIEPLPPASVAKANAELELAMDGYCAVTVIEKDQWVEGNPEFGVVHLGRLYLFCDQAAMDRFLKTPEPYTPVLNGIDVVRFFEEHKIVQGNRDWGLKDPDHNRMFFFADEAALNHFYNQHTRYTDAALTVMAKAVKDANP